MILARLIAIAVALRLDRASAGGLDATFELRVRVLRSRAPVALRLEVRNGTCAVLPGRAPHAGAVATIGAGDMLRLAAGVVGWPQLLSRGRLELTGDPFLALRFPALLRLPVAGRSAGAAA